LLYDAHENADFVHDVDMVKIKMALFFLMFFFFFLF